ncbi:phosphoribosyl-ATP pyrophosphohydrolase [Thalassospira sp. MBR-102]|jgi:phosphoribosyl-ATP pyrophosphohydrolase|uniref:Phosphoribosyl-ATP pyrophosphatase n=2 Tax=Thalassospira xiamenensis TaxID=220697 RepID=A0ABR5XYT6_9PROT|nr:MULTISPECIES: phosphoribosyl-ATP diphosphatase [Thalassospira]AJD54145.1 Phosphoribosyl-ATP pyrophosphatase [Thalassospira xiamenensis M-5 = DSM 17429]KZD01675.1 phosphoribosyl-ATP pyrophosphatase [Thalassospira xiamenensis]KZD11161.1 phosphoribosyl-ATP pyrophosphatase [Thalassospira xiamenensis]MAB32658.1 phosphoribosyl-ATP diphosphatase [Thalassospira sp.]MAL28357.1 phosphoribosyl-ATP diphosphatase [Thalassospira sp.]|tara:strand:- start:745 stop:1071 length:327 start_codon:yes stop_codon:yes gene_type:complete
MTDKHILDQLYTVIAARKGADPETSYTARLFAKGTAKIAQKVGEEGVETVIAALAETPEKVASESADLLYHLTVLWADQGVKPEDVWNILAERQGISGIAEKASRTDK